MFTKASGVVTIAYNAAQWKDFASGAIVAGTTLSGLVFVAVSINLNRILGHPSFPNRAWQTLGLLATPMVIGFLLIVPGQSNTVLGWELIFLAVLLGGARVVIHYRATRTEKDTPLPLVGFLAGLVPSFVPPLVSYACLALAGATLLARVGGGLYWLVPSLLLSFFVGLLNAWALLVDIPS